MPPSFLITAFYKFFPIPEADLARVQADLQRAGEEAGLCGLLLIATEGINGTIAGSPEAITTCKDFLQTHFNQAITFKDSTADEQPFKRWFVKIREEIVALGDQSVVPDDPKHRHLTPQEWNDVIENEDVVIIDTRNDYETEIGMFKGAVDPQLKQFSEFPEYVKHAGIPKDKKVLMYCTGGIRCEKALLEMERQGYTNVYQLSGGILKYIEECPRQQFEGECFVFDHRAAVDQDLQPSERYVLCPHCGDPGDQRIACERCQKSAIICERCLRGGKPVCSKDCAYHYVS